MLKDILVPLDGSELAEQALPYARQIVEDEGKITVMMVVNSINVFTTTHDSPILIPGAEKHAENQQQELIKHANDYLSRIVDTISSANITIETLVLVGQPENEIVDLATNSTTDAIVMSTHGRTGLSRWLMGSVTQKVLGVAPCPVFVIPGEITE